MQKPCCRGSSSGLLQPLTPLVMRMHKVCARPALPSGSSTIQLTKSGCLYTIVQLYFGFMVSCFTHFLRLSTLQLTVLLLGKPGAGKTVLAATLVEHLKDVDANPFYFFFDSLQSSSKGQFGCIRCDPVANSPQESIEFADFGSHQLHNPLSKYTTSNWHAHMLATNGTLVEVQNAHTEEPDAYGDFISALCQLLSRPSAVSAWIQSCYAFHWEPPYLSLMEWAAQSDLPNFPWRQYSPQIDDVIPNIRELAQYLNWIITDWSVHLHEDPSCIYDEAAAFIKSEYATRPSDIAVKKLVSATPASNLSSEPLHKISKMMPDGKQDYVLSIYPPM